MRTFLANFSLLQLSMCFLFPEAPRFESIMEDIEVGIGETPQFAVVVEGKPLPDIMWYKVNMCPILRRILG